MGKSDSGQQGGGDADFVNLTIPRTHAQDLVQALNLALGSEGEKSKNGKKGKGSKKK